MDPIWRYCGDQEELEKRDSKLDGILRGKKGDGVKRKMIGKRGLQIVIDSAVVTNVDGSTSIATDEEGI